MVDDHSCLDQNVSNLPAPVGAQLLESLAGLC